MTMTGIFQALCGRKVGRQEGAFLMERRGCERRNRYYPLESIASDGQGNVLVGKGSTVNVSDSGTFLVCSDGLPVEGMWIAASMRVEEFGLEPRNITFTGRVMRVDRFEVEGHPWEGQIGVAVRFDRAPRW